MKKIKITLILIFFAVISQVAFGQTLQEARAAFARKDFTVAFAGFLKFAESGDAAAQATVANMYSTGQGTNKDEALGHSWAIKAAEQGNALGQSLLGFNFSKGRGVTMNESLGVYWYKKAVEQGNLGAMNNLANMYKNGQGVPQDFQKSIELLNAAIAKDSRYPIPYLSLAEMYSKGKGVPENQIEALRLANLGVSKMNSSMPAYEQAQKQISEISQKIAITANANQLPNSTSTNSPISASTVGGRVLSPQDSRKECEAKLSNDNRLSVIGSKLSLNGPTGIGFAMLADQSLPSPSEQKAISLFADGVRKCAKDDEALRQQNYSKEINTALAQFDASFMDLAIELYNKKITYGKFNTRLQQLDKDLSDKLTDLTKQASIQKNEQDQANRARAEAMRDAQRRQDQARQADEQRIQQQRQAEQDRINANRSRWAARCNLDKTNAYEQSKVQYKNECDSTYANAANTPINRLGVVACVLSIDKKAEEYAKVTFDACMSGAP